MLGAASPASASSEDIACNGELCAVPMVEGQSAPFSGQLISTELALRLGMKADECDARMQLEKDYYQKRTEALVIKEQQLREIERESCSLRESIIRKHLERPGWDRMGVGIGVGVITTIIIVIGTGMALGGLTGG